MDQLARFRRRGLARGLRRRPRRGSCCGRARTGARVRSPDPHRLPDHDRQGSAQSRRVREDAWGAAWRSGGRGDAAEHRLAVSAVRDPRRRRSGLARGRPRAARRRESPGSGVGRTHALRETFDRALAGELPETVFEGLQAIPQPAFRESDGGRHAQGVRDGARLHQRRNRADRRRIGGSDALQPDADEGNGGHRAGGLSPAATSTTACASTAWRRR